MYPLPITTALYVPHFVRHASRHTPNQDVMPIHLMSGSRTFSGGGGERPLFEFARRISRFYNVYLKKFKICMKVWTLLTPPPPSRHTKDYFQSMSLSGSTPRKTSPRRVDVTIMKSKYQQSSEPAFHRGGKSSPQIKTVHLVYSHIPEQTPTIQRPSHRVRD